ncbi:MAG: hypothetical protein J0L97_09035, partial [Alphaproteobacteria bacterium]|nr:hypothetical protein [Alphaproteobacteria bacterium]
PSFFAAPTEATLGRIPFSVAPPPIAAPNIGDHPKPGMPVQVPASVEAASAARLALSLAPAVPSPVTMATGPSLPFLAQMLWQGVISPETGASLIGAEDVPVLAENLRAARSPALKDPIKRSEAHVVHHDPSDVEEGSETQHLRSVIQQQPTGRETLPAATVSTQPRPVFRDATSPLRRGEALPRTVLPEDVDMQAEERLYKLLPNPFGIVSSAYQKTMARNENIGKHPAPVVPF